MRLNRHPPARCAVEVDPLGTRPEDSNMLNEAKKKKQGVPLPWHRTRGRGFGGWRRRGVGGGRAGGGRWWWVGGDGRGGGVGRAAAVVEVVGATRRGMGYCGVGRCRWAAVERDESCVVTVCVSGWRGGEGILGLELYPKLGEGGVYGGG